MIALLETCCRCQVPLADQCLYPAVVMNVGAEDTFLVSLLDCGTQYSCPHISMRTFVPPLREEIKVGVVLN